MPVASAAVPLGRTFAAPPVRPASAEAEQLDANHFDDLLRSLAAPATRRGVGHALALVIAERSFTGFSPDAVMAKKRKRRKKRKKQGCKGGTITCGGVCCAPEGCLAGACCPPARRCGTICCGADQLCGDPATELCVVGQGTCPAGADSCASGAVTCNSPETCGCFQSTSTGTRCGQLTASSVCGQCASDADCVALLAVPGAFCVRDFSAPCPCDAGENVCAVPCPG